MIEEQLVEMKLLQIMILRLLMDIMIQEMNLINIVLNMSGAVIGLFNTFMLVSSSQQNLYCKDFEKTGYKLAKK